MGEAQIGEPHGSRGGTGPDLASRFDPTAWLQELEACGGWISLYEEESPGVQWSTYGNTVDEQSRIATMLHDISDDQMAEVIAAREAEAASFQPELWCVEFNAVGGSVFAMAGEPWTGIPEQAANRAFRMRNRLVPEEIAKLRSFLRLHLDLEMVH